MLDQIDNLIASDKSGVLESTKLLADQCRQAWQETQALSLPQEYLQVHSAVVAGMGGSHLGAQLIYSVFESNLKAPLLIVNEYQTPGYIGPETLVLATSYSGNTQETLDFVKEAQDKHAKIICISSGGQLESFAKDHSLPFYTFDSQNNPSRIPRYGSGYLFIAQMVLLAKAGIISLTYQEIDQITSALNSSQVLYDLNAPTDQNPAKQLAIKLHQKQVILVASQHLAGSAYIFKNQLNESAKHFSTMFKIPELNHHLLEGLAHPQEFSSQAIFVFFESLLYHPQNQTRYLVTSEIVAKQGFELFSFKPQSPDPLSQAFETLAFTSYVAIYLSFLNQVDPGPNPWVDELKSRLKT